KYWRAWSAVSFSDHLVKNHPSLHPLWLMALPGQLSSLYVRVAPLLPRLWPAPPVRTSCLRPARLLGRYAHMASRLDGCTCKKMRQIAYGINAAARVRVRAGCAGLK